MNHTKSRRYRWRIIALCLSGLLLLTACKSSVQPVETASTVVKPHPTDVAFGTLPPRQLGASSERTETWRLYQHRASAINLNPLSGKEGFPVSGLATSDWIYETLFYWDEQTDRLTPLLAESLNRASDGQVDVVLREGCSWHDGKPVLAQDVVYSFELLLRYNFRQYQALRPTLLTVESIDDRRVRFAIAPEHWTLFQVALRQVVILPKHLWQPLEQELGSNAKTIAEYTKIKPVGSGPYRLKLHDQFQIVLERFDDYFAKRAPDLASAPQTINMVRYRDAAAAEVAMRAGEIDAWTGIAAPAASRLQELLPPENSHWLGLDQSLVYLRLNAAHSGLKDASVRLRLAAIAEQTDLGQLLFGEHATAIKPWQLLGGPAYCARQGLTASDFTMETSTLQRAATTPTPAATGDDAPVRLGPWTVVCPADASAWIVAGRQLIRSAASAGIDLTLETVPRESWEKRVASGDYDILITRDYYSSKPEQLQTRIIRFAGLDPNMGAAERKALSADDRQIFELTEQLGQATAATERKPILVKLAKSLMQKNLTIPLAAGPSNLMLTNATHWPLDPGQMTASDTWMPRLLPGTDLPILRSNNQTAD